MVLSSLWNTAFLTVFLGLLLLGYIGQQLFLMLLKTRRREPTTHLVCLPVVGSLGFSMEMSGQPE